MVSHRQASMDKFSFGLSFDCVIVCSRLSFDTVNDCCLVLVKELSNKFSPVTQRRVLELPNKLEVPTDKVSGMKPQWDRER